MICLDTNAVIAILNDRSRSVRKAFDATNAANVAIGMSVIVYNELIFGAAASERRQQNDQRVDLFVASANIEILAFTTEDAREAADIRAYLKRMGSVIGLYDVLIAAQALRRGATIITANDRDFDRFPGLTVTNWAEWVSYSHTNGPNTSTDSARAAAASLRSSVASGIANRTASAR